MTFGENCKMYRQKKHLTQEEVASAIGISKRMYIYYETGQKFPRKMDTIVKLAEFFNVDINQLIIVDIKAWIELQRNRPSSEKTELLISEIKNILTDEESDDEIIRSFCCELKKLCNDYLKRFTDKETSVEENHE